ncbi:MAG TPA: HDOD domain-containing protein [Terriglobales bacterium]|nr:HDOD domain-containing protein [Terriglobales bacterium]
MSAKGIYEKRGAGSFPSPGYSQCPGAFWTTQYLPRLTPLKSTLVEMELLLNAPPVDLFSLAQVVQKDVVLASQLLRLANTDRHPQEYLLRIEDCLVDVGIDWLLALVEEVPLSPRERT